MSLGYFILANICQAQITKTALFKYIENFTTKTWNCSDKISDSFHISAQNIDRRCSLEPPHRGSSNEYPQSMILRRNKKNNLYPCKPQFYYIKVGFIGVKIILVCFRDDVSILDFWLIHSIFKGNFLKILPVSIWLGPPWFTYWLSFTLAFSRISHEYSSLFIIVINLIFYVFALMHWLS